MKSAQPHTKRDMKLARFKVHVLTQAHNIHGHIKMVLGATTTTNQPTNEYTQTRRIKAAAKGN